MYFRGTSVLVVMFLMWYGIFTVTAGTAAMMSEERAVEMEGNVTSTLEETRQNTTRNYTTAVANYTVKPMVNTGIAIGKHGARSGTDFGLAHPTMANVHYKTSPFILLLALAVFTYSIVSRES